MEWPKRKCKDKGEGIWKEKKIGGWKVKAGGGERGGNSGSKEP